MRQMAGTHSGNYPIDNAGNIHPDEGHTAIRVGGDLYHFDTLCSIIDGPCWFAAVREYRRRNPNVGSAQAGVNLLAQHGIGARSCNECGREC